MTKAKSTQMRYAVMAGQVCVESHCRTFREARAIARKHRGQATIVRYDNSGVSSYLEVVSNA